MVQLLLKIDTVWIAVIGFLFVFFILPQIMGAAFNRAEKEADKGNGFWLGVIIFGVFILVIIVSIMQLKDCSKSNNYTPEREYRHTQLQKPTQNNVNNIIFTPS